MSMRLVRRATLALFVAAGLALAAPAAAAQQSTPGSGWLAALWGGLQWMLGAEGGCIDPDGARCKAQPSGSGLSPTGGAASAPGKAGGLRRVLRAEGGCIDPDGARCKAQPNGSGLASAAGVASPPAVG